MPPKRGGRQNIMGGVILLTLYSIAFSMRLFLKWIEEHDVNWQEVYAINDTEQEKYWLPVTGLLAQRQCKYFWIVGNINASMQI